VLGQWMTKKLFLDSLALSSVIPAPMVIFSSFVGHRRPPQLAVQYPALPTVVAEMIGSVLCSMGMFLPVFVITIAAGPSGTQSEGERAVERHHRLRGGSSGDHSDSLCQVERWY
jgi:hypothetical protein